MGTENIEQVSVKLFLSSGDPLSVEAIERLINHKEEDLYVDYKEAFDPDDEKQWIGITSDAMAFANMMGGYIVFGVRDSDFSVIGVPESVSSQLTDTNMIMQKLNRYVAPPFTLIRSKSHKTESGVVIVVVFVPESRGKTHIFVKDVSHKYPSGETKQIIRAGTIFVRRSATNHVVEPEDLEFIINRRIEHYKDSILSKIAKVVEAPSEHELLIFDPKAKGEGDKTYYITDSSEAIPVKGMSFTVVPSTDIEELCGCISLSKRDPSFQPSKKRLWYFYSIRNNLSLTVEQRQEMIRFSLLGELPIFFWLQSLSAEKIKAILFRVFRETRSRFIRWQVLDVSVFLGKTAYTKLLKQSGEKSGQLRLGLKRFPDDPVELFHPGLAGNGNREKLESELTSIAEELSGNIGGVMRKMKAKALDCILYARRDKYVTD